MTAKLETLLLTLEKYIVKTSNEILEQKPSQHKWSKKEILGHLIDSGINNLQRFIEIQFKKQPYQINSYDQDALVKINNYQHKDKPELLNMWLTINHHIIYVINALSKESLSLQIVVNNEKRDLIPIPK